MLFQKWWYIRSILKYSSPLLSPLEKHYINQYGHHTPDQPCLFIIGPPRSGSTILYQLITSLLEVEYVDNLANLARNNPYFGSRLSKLFFPSAKHENYTSEHGSTAGGGLHAPAEPLFFYKWFPKDRHFTTVSDLNPEQIDEFRKTIYAMINKAGKPLVIKNLSFSLRLQALREILPDARYVVIRRAPLYTSQSLLLAMRKVRHPEHQVWGILPRDFHQLEKLDQHEMVVRQVHEIESQINQDLKGIPEKNILFTDYEHLEHRTQEILKEISTLIQSESVQTGSVQGIEPVSDPPNPAIKVKNRILLPENEIGILRKHIASLDWELHDKPHHGKIQ